MKRNSFRALLALLLVLSLFVSLGALTAFAGDEGDGPGIAVDPDEEDNPPAPSAAKRGDGFDSMTLIGLIPVSTLEYDANGGTFADGSSSAKLQVRGDSEVAVHDAPIKQGDEFVAWQSMGGTDWSYPGMRLTASIRLMRFIARYRSELHFAGALKPLKLGYRF